MKNTEALYLTKPENIRYQTGFIGSYGVAIVIDKNKFLITDGRYTEQAKKLCYKDVEIIILQDSLNLEAAKIFQKHKIKNIGFEANHLSYFQALNLRKNHKQQRWLPLNKEIDQLRKIKTVKEINILEKSQTLNEETLSKTLEILKPGISETEVAWQIYKIARDLGAEDTSFDPIIAFGKNSASPHYMPDKNCKLKQGDTILIDMGLKYEGYCSDMTRCFFTAAPTSKQTEVYNTVLAAQINAINNIKPGNLASSGDKLSREIITKAGFGDFFTHANGHGVGLEIHEAPSLSSKTKHKDRKIKFTENMVVTVEPGIYLPNQFGIRIEDMITIKKDQNQNLTKFPKQLEDVIIKL